MRVVPLVIEEEKMNQVKEICGEEPIFRLLPYRKMKVGIVTTGNEVLSGRINDQFTPVVGKKLEEAGMEVMGNVLSGDDSERVTEAIRQWLDKGAEMVVCTGGMSVDPDDRTPLAIRNAADTVITYGAPVLVVVANQAGYCNAMADSAVAIENMMLEATAQGIGSCWLNQLHWLDQRPSIRREMLSLGLDEAETICGAVALGYSNQPLRPPLPRHGNPVTFID